MLDQVPLCDAIRKALGIWVEEIRIEYVNAHLFGDTMAVSVTAVLPPSTLCLGVLESKLQGLIGVTIEVVNSTECI